MIDTLISGDLLSSTSMLNSTCANYLCTSDSTSEDLLVRQLSAVPLDGLKKEFYRFNANATFLVCC